MLKSLYSNHGEHLHKPNINQFLKKWYKLCTEESINSFQPPLNFALNFLKSIKTNGRNFGTVSNTRSALSSIISIDSIPFGKNQYVCRFMKGIFNNETSKPKYDVMWDPDIVLNFI